MNKSEIVRDASMCVRAGFALVLAVLLAACGRQVTGLNTSTGNSLPSGQMLLRFRTLAPMDFTNFRYVMVFNTSGTGTEPYANAFQTGFQNYSFAFVVGGSGGAVSQPALFQYFLVPGSASGLGSRNIPYPTQVVQFDANSRGDFTEFTLVFQRALFNQANPVQATPGPGATPSPAPMTARTWYLNYFTTDPSLTPIDALGVQGKNDVSYTLQLDTQSYFDFTQQLAVPAGTVQLPQSQAAAQLVTGGEVINSP